MSSSTLTADGNTPLLARGSGGPVSFVIFGNVGGGTIAERYSVNSQSNIADELDANIVYPANSDGVIFRRVLPSGVSVYFNLSGATGANVTFTAFDVGL